MLRRWVITHGSRRRGAPRRPCGSAPAWQLLTVRAPQAPLSSSQHCGPAAPTNIIINAIFMMFQSITSIVAIEKASDDLIKRLSTPDDTAKMLKLIAVVGTTLAKVAFDRIQNLFYCSCFVPVGRKPNLKKVFKYI
jgi:hypothetical protein